MHLELDSFNPIFLAFELRRKELGYTTCKSALLSSMRMFVEQGVPDYINDAKTTPTDGVALSDVDFNIMKHFMR